MQVMYIVNILPKVFILRIIKAPGLPMRQQEFPLVPSQELLMVNAGGGYVWRKVLADSPKESIEIDLISKIGNHDKRPLVQKNLDGEIVGEFLSIAHASRSLKISRRSLSCALSGAQKTAGGYIWEEKMEDDMQVQEQ